MFDLDDLTEFLVEHPIVFFLSSPVLIWLALVGEFMKETENRPLKPRPTRPHPALPPPSKTPWQALLKGCR